VLAHAVDPVIAYQHWRGLAPLRAGVGLDSLHIRVDQDARAFQGRLGVGSEYPQGQGDGLVAGLLYIRSRQHEGGFRWPFWQYRASVNDDQGEHAQQYR